MRQIQGTSASKAPTASRFAEPPNAKPKTEWEVNEELVEKSDPEAIRRKAEGLAYGYYGYEKNPQAAREFNDSLIENGDQKAITRKIEGLAHGGDRYNVQSTHSLHGSCRFHPTYGYEKNPEAARKFNNELVARGDQEAIKRKISALTHGGDGYEVTDWFDFMPSVTRYYPTYGYVKDPEAAREFEEFIRAQFTNLK
jgi:hypothetical protein